MTYVYNKGACSACGARSGLLTIYFCNPYPITEFVPSLGYRPTGETGWRRYGRAQCVDRTACQARRNKALERSRVRSKLIVLAQPQFPDAPAGQCRWCGETLTGENASRRRYCYLEREGRDCIGENARSRVWTARAAVQHRGDEACAICGSEDPNWDADHIVALEDGGEHTLENLRRLCQPCHKAKTQAENRARRHRRAAPGVNTAAAS